MCKTIAVIGGDMRMVYLAKMLTTVNNVVTFGQELVKIDDKNLNSTLNNIQKAEALKEAIEKSEIIIAPIPFSKDGEHVYTKFSKNKILLNEVLQYCKAKTLIAGAISKDISNLAKGKNINIIDLMQNESLAVLNSIATAEGAVEVAIRKTKEIIHGSNVLILGFGRVAKVVAQKFAGLSANITCAARKPEAFAWIEACGYKCIDINKLEKNLEQYDIIINTPPALILNRQKIMLLKKNCLVIDLASKPGGVDINAINEFKIDFEWPLALPGKVAPITAAKHIKRAIEEELI